MNWLLFIDLDKNIEQKVLEKVVDSLPDDMKTPLYDKYKWWYKTIVEIEQFTMNEIMLYGCYTKIHHAESVANELKRLLELENYKVDISRVYW